MPEFTSPTNRELIDALADHLVIHGVRVDVPTQTTSNHNQKEMQHMLFNYIQERTAKGQPKKDGTPTTVKLHIRKVTTDLPDAIADSFDRSMANHKVVNNILALYMGNWTYRLLEELAAKGLRFTITVMNLKEINNTLDPEGLIRRQIKLSTFAYANADNAIFIKVEGDESKGLGAMGLSVQSKKKSAKRLMEIMRLSEMSWHSNENRELWDVKVEKFPGMDQKLFDGCSYMRRRMAIGLCYNVTDLHRRSELIRSIMTGKLTRCVLRGLDDSAVTKGDVIIVEDHQIDHDLVTYHENLKTELVTAGMKNYVIWAHEPRHTAVYDVQSTINFGDLFPEDVELADLSFIFTSMKEKIESGELPKWLELGEWAYTESGVPNMEKLSDDLHKVYVRLQAMGGDIKMFQNILFMAWNGMAMKMDTPFRDNKATGRSFRTKTWIPMSNAVLGSVITYESLTMMGGFEFPEQDGSIVFWDERVGLVIPGKRFIETYELHGGWDLDDGAKARKIMLWASGDIEVHRGKTIPMDMVVPTKVEDALAKLAIVRSPNGPGEYSIEDADFTNLIDPEMDRPELVPVVDLSKMPLPQGELLKNVTVTGLASSTNYSGKEMTEEDMVEMVLAQLQNPGIGRFCNAIMVYYHAMGAFPENMLEIMETIVDTCQQGYDLAAFEAIEQCHEDIIGQLVDKVEMDPSIKIDIAIATTRMNAEHAGLVSDRLVEGRFSRLQTAYTKMLNRVKEMSGEASLKARNETEVVKALLGAKPMSQPRVDAVRSFYWKINNQLKALGAEYRVQPWMSPFHKMHVEQMHNQMMKDVIAAAVAEVEAKPERERYIFMIDLYRWICTPVTGKPYGIYDRLIVQPGHRGDKNLMDILIEAFAHFDRPLR